DDEEPRRLVPRPRRLAVGAAWRGPARVRVREMSVRLLVGVVRLGGLAGDLRQRGDRRREDGVPARSARRRRRWCPAPGMTRLFIDSERFLGVAEAAQVSGMSVHVVTSA